MDILTARCEQLGDNDKFHTEPYMDVSVEYLEDQGKPLEIDQKEGSIAE